MDRRGTIKINLGTLIEKRGTGKSKLSQRAETRRTQLNNCCNNAVTRLDIDALARLCTVLDRGVGNLLEFVGED